MARGLMTHHPVKRVRGRIRGAHALRVLAMAPCQFSFFKYCGAAL
jgi:hypothetical protein